MLVSVLLSSRPYNQFDLIIPAESRSAALVPYKVAIVSPSGAGLRSDHAFPVFSTMALIPKKLLTMWDGEFLKRRTWQEFYAW